MSGSSTLLQMAAWDKSKFKGFDGSQVVVTDDMVLFWKPPGVFGQWTDSVFRDEDGVKYGCAEQYMMAEKAKLFGDENIRKCILETDCPRAQQKLGKQVTGFDQATWEKHRLPIVTRGNILKFSQNPEMLSQLLATGTRTIVEASPADKIWGIGLRADDPAAHKRSKWQGLNLLGQALMDARAHLADQSS